MNEVPFWELVVGNYQRRVLIILGMTEKWYRKPRRWCPDLRYKIGQREDKISNQGIDLLL